MRLGRNCRSVVLAGLLVIGFGCNGNGGTVQDGAAGDAAMTDGTAMACMPEGQASHRTDDPPANHVASIAGITYPSNPPASGPHCGSWGRYGLYQPEQPLPRCTWLHNLEHGAVVLLYNCPNGCPDIVAALEQVYRTAALPMGCRERPVIITPDAELDVTVAAAAWGYTWKSSCLDAAAQAELVKFIEAHQGTAGQAPEAALACF